MSSCIPNPSLIDAYIDLGLFWNKTIPLFAKSMTKERIKEKMDGIMAQAHVYPMDDPIIDLGSGNGILGITLSMATNHSITLVESRKKKVSFLHAAKTALGLKFDIVSDRIEQIYWPSFIASPTTLTAMALAPLTQLLEFLHHVSRETPYQPIKGIFWKGQRCIEEIHEAEKKWSFSYDFPSSSLVQVWNVCPKIL
jgi:16S rRNA (guanine(527)-N(7))-methyltransferase RsmG